MVDSNHSIIEIRNVKAYVHQTKVFDNLTLEISNGSNTVILGPNGAGKTTLLKLLAREIYPVYNENSFIKILGHERWNLWELRSHLGIVSHSLQQNYPDDTLGINVILSGFYGSSDVWDYQTFTQKEINKAAEILETLGIAALRDREFSMMSTGEQRRFLLGRALVHDPRVLLLDEPTTGLDIKATFLYMNIIRRLMQEGKTVILVTHHIHEIPPEISRMILLKDGRVISEGDKKEIMENEKISSLYDVPLKVISSNGFYQALPA